MRLVDVGKDLATDVLATSLLVVHDTGRGGEDHLAERTSREEEGDPVLDSVNGNVEAGRDDTALVKTAVELDDDLAGAVVVNNLKLANVTCVLAWSDNKEKICHCRSVQPKHVSH